MRPHSIFQDQKITLSTDLQATRPINSINKENQDVLDLGKKSRPMSDQRELKTNIFLKSIQTTR